jgi:hypothetical protein
MPRENEDACAILYGLPEVPERSEAHTVMVEQMPHPARLPPCHEHPTLGRPATAEARQAPHDRRRFHG